MLTSMESPLPSISFDPCSGESHEDLRWKLMYTSIELQKVRAEGRLQETELQRLQELLSIMMKERDEAREECRKLQECVLLQQAPATGVDSASSFMLSSSIVSSPSSSPWSLQELEEHLNSDDFCPSVGAPTPLELQQALESLVQGCDKGQFSHSKPESVESALRDAPLETHMETLNQGLCFDGPSYSNFPVAPSHANDEIVCTRSPSVRSLSRQSSSNSSSASVQQYQRGQVSMESLDAIGAMPSRMTQSAPAIAIASMVSNSPPSSVMVMKNCASYTPQQILPVASLAGSSVTTITSESMPLVPTLSSCGACPIAQAVSDNVSCINNHALPSTAIKCNNNGASIAINSARQMPYMADDKLLINTSASCSMPVKANSVAFLDNTITPPRPLAGNNAPSITSNSPIRTRCMAPSMGCPTLPTTKSSVSSLIANSQLLAPSAKALSSGMVLTSSSHCHQQTIPTPVRQFHLPEPPEADPQVMLNSLPEKGKLLQAVMQAGPLLQTLLLAGPLPQWRHPPPSLSTRDIPKVSLVPGHVISSPTASNGLPMTITRKRIAVVESGLQNKKLRKLSSSSMKKGKTLRTVSGGSAWQELTAS